MRPRPPGGVAGRRRADPPRRPPKTFVRPGRRGRWWVAGIKRDNSVRTMMDNTFR